MTTVVLHQAVGGLVLVPGNLAVIVSGYLGTLAILAVFGIWGFRLGSRRSRGNPGGGGPKRPEPATPPPGGRELNEECPLSDPDVMGDLDLPVLDEQVHERTHELVAPGLRQR